MGPCLYYFFVLIFVNSRYESRHTSVPVLLQVLKLPVRDALAVALAVPSPAVLRENVERRTREAGQAAKDRAHWLEHGQRVYRVGSG